MSLSDKLQFLEILKARSGLSIAKSIVDVHKGKISAYINEDDMICFKIVL